MQKTLENKPVEIWGDGTIIRVIYSLMMSLIAILAATYGGNNKIFNIGSGYGKNVLEIIECIKLAIQKHKLYIEGRSRHS